MTTFTVYRKEKDDINPPVAIATGLTAKSYVDATAQSDKTYLYSVAAVRDAVEKISSEVKVSTLIEYANTYLELEIDILDRGLQPLLFNNVGVVISDGKAVFNGSQYLVSSVKSSSFAFGVGAFTIEFVASLAQSGAGVVLDMRNVYQNSSASGASYANLIQFSSTSVGWSNGLVVHEALYAFDLNKEYAISITRDALNNLRIFIDGEKILETTDTTNISGNRYLHIGVARLTNGGLEAGFKGTVRRVRTTKGVAKYTENYTITYQK